MVFDENVKELKESNETREEKERRKRKEFNEDIVKRLKAGEPLQEKASITYFPPRPIIQKDTELVKKLYGDDAKIVGKNHLEVVKE